MSSTDKIQTNTNGNFDSSESSSHMIPPGSGGLVSEPNLNDVLCGRGGAINAHEGNVRFREIVNENKHEYLAKNTKKSDKAHIAARIVAQIRKMDPSGRFLKQDKDSGLWTEIGDQNARKKAGQALREDAPELRSAKNNQNQGQNTNPPMNGGYWVPPGYAMPPPPQHGYPHPYPPYYPPQYPPNAYPYNNPYPGHPPPMPGHIPPNPNMPHQYPQNYPSPHANQDPNAYPQNTASPVPQQHNSPYPNQYPQSFPSSNGQVQSPMQPQNQHEQNYHTQAATTPVSQNPQNTSSAQDQSKRPRSPSSFSFGSGNLRGSDTLTLDSTTLEAISGLKDEVNRQETPANIEKTTQWTNHTTKNEVTSSNPPTSFASLRGQKKLSEVAADWAKMGYRDGNQSGDDDDDNSQGNREDMSWMGGMQKSSNDMNQVSQTAKMSGVETSQWERKVKLSNNGYNNTSMPPPQSRIPPPAHTSTEAPPSTEGADNDTASASSELRSEWRQQMIQVKAWQKKKSEMLAAAMNAVSDTGRDASSSHKHGDSNHLRRVTEENMFANMNPDTEVYSDFSLTGSDLMSIGDKSFSAMMNGEDSSMSMNQSMSSQSGVKNQFRRDAMMKMSGKSQGGRSGMMASSAKFKSTRSSNMSGDFMTDDSSWMKSYKNMPGVSGDMNPWINTNASTR